MKKPILKTPPRAKHLIIDGDSILFMASSAGEQVWYVAKTPDGEEVARLESARAYTNWLDEVKTFGADLTFGFEGDIETLERHTEYEQKGVEHCHKAFDHMIKDWLKKSGCETWTMYIGKATGVKNFRYGIATIYPYKHGRSDMRKPYYLEEVRKYASKNPNVKIVRGAIEVDDKVVAEAEKLKHFSMLGFVDKDNTQSRGCWQLFIGFSDTPFFVSKKDVGNIRPEGKKIFATSYLRIALQLLQGDKSVDGIVGLPMYGPKKAYELLRDFDGVDIQYTPNVFQTVAREYQKVYGEEHTYPHCYTGEELTRSWLEMFEENLRLLWMKRHKEDNAEEIMDMVKSLRVIPCT